MFEPNLKEDSVKRLARWLSGQDVTPWTSCALSPGGTYLAAARSSGLPEQDGLWVVLADDLEARSVLTVQDILVQSTYRTRVSFSSVQWTIDETRLAIAISEGPPPGKNFTLWSAALSGPEQPQLLYRAVGHLAAYVWSPDGRAIAVADWGTGLLVVDLDGSQQKVDVNAMRYPLGRNAIAWDAHSQSLLYMSSHPGQQGLWRWSRRGPKNHLVALPEGEVMLPAVPPNPDQVLWGALRGHSRERERGVEFYWQDARDNTLYAIALPNADFDPGSDLLPDHNGTLWACTMWQKGRRIPIIIDRLAGYKKTLALSFGVVSGFAGWSDRARRLWLWVHPAELVPLDVDSAKSAMRHPDEISQDSFSLEFSSAELLALLNVLSLPGMLDLVEPQDRISLEVLEQLSVQARISLIDKGYLISSSNDTYQVDAVIATMVGCCALPEFVWTVTTEHTDVDRSVRHIYRTKALIVQDTLLPDGNHQLAPQESIFAVFQYINESWELQPTPEKLEASFVLAEEIFLRIQEIARINGKERAQRYLMGAGVAPVPADSLAQTLAHPVLRGSISRWTVADHEPVTIESGFNILKNEQCIWLIEPEADSAQLRFTLATHEVVQQKLRELLSISSL